MAKMEEIKKEFNDNWEVDEHGLGKWTTYSIGGNPQYNSYKIWLWFESKLAQATEEAERSGRLKMLKEIASPVMVQISSLIMFASKDEQEFAELVYNEFKDLISRLESKYLPTTNGQDN